jgi:DNA primase
MYIYSIKLNNNLKINTMTIQEAIKKIEEAGFTANYWSKGGKQRIYVDFKFNGSKRTGGFMGRDNTNLVAAPCGRRTQKYQNKLNQFLELNIDWNSEEKKGRVITERQAAARYFREKEQEFNNEFLIGL